MGDRISSGTLSNRFMRSNQVSVCLRDKQRGMDPRDWHTIYPREK